MLVFPSSGVRQRSDTFDKHGASTLKTRKQVIPKQDGQHTVLLNAFAKMYRGHKGFDPEEQSFYNAKISELCQEEIMAHQVNQLTMVTILGVF